MTSFYSLRKYVATDNGMCRNFFFVMVQYTGDSAVVDVVFFVFTYFQKQYYHNNTWGVDLLPL